MHHSIAKEAARKAAMSAPPAPSAGGSAGSSGSLGGTVTKIVQKYVADNTGSPTPPVIKTPTHNPKVDGDKGQQETKTGSSFERQAAATYGA